ncbi:antibiotic biosynthesis monooxygenase family protein [Paenarthrobacter sp. 2TAF44]|uniref:antibiotic biosynthesis monooxygenase family protein n=1 Tax=Paenarthrobacter sp. 2TAF44 TaxID=3233018 RepID=UPI003F97DE97
MIYEHADLRINPDTEEKFVRDFSAVRKLLVEAEGCHSVELLVSVDSPNTYLLRVGWENIEDHTVRFPGTSEANELRRVLMEHCVTPPQVLHFSGQDVLISL